MRYRRYITNRYKRYIYPAIITSAGIFGCVVPAGAWHTVEVLEPSVIMEVKDGRYGEDGSESFFNNR